MNRFPSNLQTSSNSMKAAKHPGGNLNYDENSSGMSGTYRTLHSTGRLDTYKEVIQHPGAVDKTEKQIALENSEKEILRASWKRTRFSNALTSLRVRISINKKQCLLIGIIFFLLLAAVICTAGVLGSRAAKFHDNNEAASSLETTTYTSAAFASTYSNKPSSTSASPLSSQTAVVARNSTGIAVLFQSRNLTGASGDFLTIFQDCTGELLAVRLSANEVKNGPLDAANSKVLGIQAANGTGLAGLSITMSDKFEYYVVVYVDLNGTLSDAWADSTLPDGPWNLGNLSHYGFSVPLEHRPAMHIAKSCCWGKNEGDLGIHVWAGGMGGGISQHSFDISTGTWNSMLYVLQEASSFSGISSIIEDCSNITLYATDQTGQLISMFQKVNNSTNWPFGGSSFNASVFQSADIGLRYPFTGVAANVYTQNSSLTSVYYVRHDANTDTSSEPKIGRIVVDHGGPSPSNLVPRSVPALNISAMPGTDIAVFSSDSFHGRQRAILVYQQDANKIQLEILYG